MARRKIAICTCLSILYFSFIVAQLSHFTDVSIFLVFIFTNYVIIVGLYNKNCLLSIVYNKF